MSDPLKRAMAAVRADADAVILAAPGAVRRVGTRRTRMKALSAAFAALVVIIGASIGANQYFQQAAPVIGETPKPPVPSDTATPTPTPSTTPTIDLPAATPQPDPCSTDATQCYPPGAESF